MHTIQVIVHIYCSLDLRWVEPETTATLFLMYHVVFANQFFPGVPAVATN